MSGADKQSWANVIELEPRVEADVLEPWTHGASASLSKFEVVADAPMALKIMASLRETTHSLRRIRLAAAALFLALAFGVLLLSSFFGIGVGVSDLVRPHDGRLALRHRGGGRESAPESPRP